jgi:putative ABC transport system permease protein
VRQVESSRLRSLRLAFDRPEVTLIAKPVDLQHPETTVALIGLSELPDSGLDGRLVVYGSEAMADLYGWRAGHEATLPLSETGPQTVWVAGLFRDYGRQHGSVIIPLADYERLTGERTRSNLSVWLDEDADPAQVLAQIQAKLGNVDLKWASARDLRQLSLTIFDRSFAMTYALEAVALLVALFSVAAGVTGQLIVRRREFGVLAQLGLSGAQCCSMVSLEVGLLLIVATVWASLLGGLISQILIQKVNPQSFHWSMATHVALGPWAISSATLLLIGVFTARWAARQCLDFHRLSQSLRADW